MSLIVVCSVVFYLSRMFHTIWIIKIQGSFVLNIQLASVPANECKTKQFGCNGQLFIQFSDVFQYNLTFISENIECCQGISRLPDLYVLENCAYLMRVVNILENCAYLMRVVNFHLDLFYSIISC